MGKKKLKVVTTFSGIGMQERGLENTNLFDLDVLNTCETDIYAIISYAAIHNNLTPELIKEYDYPSREEMAKELSEKHIGYDFIKKKEYDWNKKVKSKKDTLLQTTWLACKLNKNVGDIARVKKFPYCDLFTFSFPCFIAGTLVLTKEGYKPIEEIKVGEEVFTHKRRWKRVTKVYKNEVKDKLIKITGKPCKSIKCTKNHPFYIKRDEEIQWIEAKDLVLTDNLSTPLLPLGLETTISENDLNGKISNFISQSGKLTHTTLKMFLDGILDSRALYNEAENFELDLLDYSVMTKEEMLWSSIDAIEEVSTEESYVFNLEVEEDNSYIVQNVAVHNCTDLSTAGKQQGMIKGKTRSGLVYEVIRILGNMKERPRFLLMENVSALINKKNISAYEDINKQFKQLGYDVKYKVLYASEAGVAQHRDRVFALYYRSDIDMSQFKFPLEFDCNLDLKDILHEEVDDKYYVNRKGIKELILDLLKKGKIKEEDFEVSNNPEDYEMIRNIRCKKSGR